MNQSPLVSVLICTYNSEQYITTTVQSVLDQSYENLELLILDNDSSDNTVEVLEETTSDRRVSVYRSEINHGPYKGLNKLIDHARGEYIAIQDHDDIWHPKKIEIQTEFLENNPKYIGCGGLPLKFFEKEYKIAKVSWPREDYCAPHPSLVFRNDGQKYAEDITYKGDVYFMRHTLCNGKKNIYNIQQPLYLSRVRADETNLSENWTDSENIKDYYTKSGELRYLILYLAYKYLPKRLVEPLRKKISRDWEYKDLNHLANSEFTKPYLRYLESDHSDM